MVLGAAYMLYLYRRVIFGRLTKEDLMAVRDLNWREKVVFAPLVVLVLWMGIYPAPFLDVMSPSVERLIENYETSLARAASPRFADLWPARSESPMLELNLAPPPPEPFRPPAAMTR